MNINNNSFENYNDISVITFVNRESLANLNNQTNKKRNLISPILIENRLQTPTNFKSIGIEKLKSSCCNFYKRKQSSNEKVTKKKHYQEFRSKISGYFNKLLIYPGSDKSKNNLFIDYNRDYLKTFNGENLFRMVNNNFQ